MLLLRITMAPAGQETRMSIVRVAMGRHRIIPEVAQSMQLAPREEAEVAKTNERLL